MLPQDFESYSVQILGETPPSHFAQVVPIALSTRALAALPTAIASLTCRIGRGIGAKPSRYSAYMVAERG